MKWLLRYGEIGLKSSWVRRSMKERLISNITMQHRQRDAPCSFKEEAGRLFLSSNYGGTPGILARTFGLVSFSPVITCSSEMDDLTRLAVDVAGKTRQRGFRFAVRVRRVGDHPYTSMEAARKIGSAILAAYPELKVDLTKPDWEVLLEIRGKRSYVASEVQPGPGGLPLGSQGRVVALVESSDGVLAAWLMMKRGCRVVPVYHENEKWVETLSHWDPEIEGRPITALEEMEEVVRATKSMGVVFPWGPEGVKVNGPRPAFYPLAGFTTDELKSLRRKVLEFSEVA